MLTRNRKVERQAADIQATAGYWWPPISILQRLLMSQDKINNGATQYHENFKKMAGPFQTRRH